MYGILSGNTIIARFAAPISVRSNQPIYSSDTLSLKRPVSRRTTQRWEIESMLEPLSAGAHELFTHLVVNGYATAFDIMMPQNYGAVLKRTSSGVATASASAGAASVTVSSNSGLIPKGTFIKFANHSKVYMTTADLTGTGSVGIYPTLRATISSATMTCRDDVKMSCVYDLDTISGMAYTDGILMNLGMIKLVENL